MIGLSIPQPVGLDLGSAVVRAVQVDSKGKLLAKLELPRAQADTPYTRDEAARIVDALRRAGVAGSSACLVAPKSALKATSLELPPPDSGAPLEVIARSELARMQDVPPSSFEVTLWIPRGAMQGSGARSLAVSCDHSAAESLIDSFASAGLDTECLTATGAAIASVERLNESERAHAVLDAGWSSAGFYVVRKGRVLFERSIRSLGMRGVAEEFGEKFGISLGLASWCAAIGRQQSREIVEASSPLLHKFGQKLADEVASSFAYVRRCWPGEEFGTLWVTGGSGEDAELCEWLGVNVGVGVEPLPVSRVLGVNARFASAWGAAAMLRSHREEAA